MSTSPLQKRMESRWIARDPNGEDEDETDRAEARCHAPTDAGCWSSAGTAGGSCCFGCGPATGTACGLTLGPEMEGGAATPKGAGLTGNYSPAVWSGTATVGTFESKEID